MEAPRLLEVDSRITSATVYSELAHVTRRAQARLSPGASRVWLRGLPTGLNPGRVRIQTSVGLVRAVELDEVRRPLPPQGEGPRTPLEALATQVYRLRGERDALAEEIAILDSLHPDPDAQRGPLRPEGFMAGLEILLKRRHGTIVALRAKEKEVERAEEALAAERRRVEGGGHTVDRVESEAALWVTIDADAGGDAAIDVTYAIGWATWRPYYQLRLDRGAQRIELTRLADVWQETGEDWDRVVMSLSTAEPEAGLVVPTVKPWRLEKRNRFEDQSRSLYEKDAKSKKMDAEGGGGERRRSMPPGAAPKMAPAPSVPMSPPPAPPASPASRILAQAASLGGFGRGQAKERAEEEVMASLDYEDGAEEMIDQDEFDETTPVSEVSGSWMMPAEVLAKAEMARDEAEPDLELRPRSPRPSSAPPKESSGGLDFEIRVAGESQQRSSAEPQRLPLGTTTYPAKIEYLLRPAIKDHAFGRVTVVHSSDQPLLGGPTALYLKDGFLGTTRIETTPAGGKLTLELGAETQIKCARRARTSMKTSGLINKDDLHLVEVEIEIESFLEQVAELEVQDQVPVTIDNKVKVKLLKTSPKDAQLDEQTGIVTFKVKVAPGSRVELSLAYEIEVPKDTRLIQALAH